MKRTQKIRATLLFVLLNIMLLAGCGKKEKQVSVWLVNQSGEDIGEVYLTSAAISDWGDNLIEAPFATGQSKEISLGSFTEDDLAAGFNVLVYDDEGELFYDTSLDEQDFQLVDGDYLVFLPPEGETLIEITSDYNEDDYADLIKGRLSAYTGYWKYDDKQLYLIINEDYEWSQINLYSEKVGPGTIKVEKDGITLYKEDGSVFTTLSQTADGGLSDESGNLLTASEDIMLLPTPNDELNMTASFPDSFSSVQIKYPMQMESHAHSGVSNALSFNAVMEDGTDDYYSNIMIAFQPISGYDSYMAKGAAVAKPYMEDMMKNFLASMYSNKVIDTFDSKFKDGGSYYSMTGYVWLDGSIFANGPSQPVRGCIEVRYYGPTGYALVAMTISMEGRINNYVDICNKMLETCTYTAGWSTAPKPVPTAPAAQNSDSGDYGTPYYWYDEDGDVWYWNGYENEFIGYGDDYYIDDDGQYYESNDAGWEYEDDGWGDYVDDYYDPWSDPGDGWGDY